MIAEEMPAVANSGSNQAKNLSHNSSCQPNKTFSNYNSNCHKPISRPNQISKNKVSDSSSSNVQKLPTKTEPIPTVPNSKFKQDNGTVKVDYRSMLHPIRINNEKWSASEACKASHICPDCQAEITSLRAELQALKTLLALN